MKLPLLLLAMASSLAATVELPTWLFPAQATASRPPVALDESVTVPGSHVTLLRRDVRTPERAVDWFPDPTNPVPAFIRENPRPGQYACGFCHLPHGDGRPENASLAGLSEDYIIDQTEGFRSGARSSASPGWFPTAAMRDTVQHASGPEIAEAARWFSRQPFVSRVTVVESAMVPRTAPLGFILARQSGPLEPIAGRIIEVPDDPEAFELRDPRSRFTAYVPPGSIAHGRDIAAQMGCIECHAEQLNGWGPGRSPSYILRQLLGFKSRARNDAGAEPMQAIADQLDMEQMVAVAAWLADGAKPAPAVTAPALR
jgi:cytochrome c553